MTTKIEFAEQCRTDNPEMIVTENGVKRKLGKKEYEEAVKAWAEMRYSQENLETQPIETIGE